jgi:pyruvate-formate lyase-activating enzyme
MGIYENIKQNHTKGDYPLTAECPNNIMAELTNVCNLSCQMCHNKDTKQEKGYMTTGLFKKIVDNSRRLEIERLGLYMTGESFLHPDIFKFIEYAKQQGIPYVYITTNGQPLNDKKIHQVFSSGLDSIKFSIDAADKETYEKLKPGGNWEHLLNVIQRMRSLRDTLGSKLRIYASFIVTKENLHDINRYREIFDELADETLFTSIGNQGSLMNVDTLYPVSFHALPLDATSPCDLLWNRINVTYDGFLTACCVDFEGQLLYGDFNQKSFEDCWNNDKMRAYRRMHVARQFNDIPMCGTCDSLLKRSCVFTAEDIKNMLGEG